jgi:hypothetical protein
VGKSGLDYEPQPLSHLHPPRFPLPIKEGGAQGIRGASPHRSAIFKCFLFVCLFELGSFLVCLCAAHVTIYIHLSFEYHTPARE